MKARDAVGKRITEIRQNRFWSNRYGGWVVELVHIELDDGTLLYVTVIEGDVTYSVKLTASKQRKEATP